MLKIVEFSKISVKIKTCKTFCKAQTANRLKKFIQSPPPLSSPPDKTLLCLGNKIFLNRYIEIHGHLLSKYLKNGVLGRHEVVWCKYFF